MGAIVALRGATWADFLRVLEIRGEGSAPRISYADGCLELVSTSKPHERLRRCLGCLVEVYCLEVGLDFTPFGSWTLLDEAAKRGLEPDECYVFGPTGEGDRPDLAIEVVWRSGGIRKLDIYAGLGVPEVWFWRRGTIRVWVLAAGAYEERPTSAALPGIDLAELAGFLDMPTASAAIKAYRDRLRSR